MSDFLADLQQIAAVLEATDSEKTFLHDLGTVERLIRQRLDVATSEVDFAELAACFDRQRAETLHKLGGECWWNQLPDFDPLRSGVGLFDTLDLGLRETAHTNFLAWLFDPSAPHKFGDCLLRRLLHEVFEWGTEPSGFTNMKSEAEYPIDGGRLDIRLSGRWTFPRQNPERFLVIIEAKIDATEGKDQCARYEHHAEKHVESGEQVRLVFLTPDGRAPHSASKGKISLGWTSLSFAELMALFRPELAGLRDKEGFALLRHYMAGVLHGIYDIDGDSVRKGRHLYRVLDYITSE